MEPTQTAPGSVESTAREERPRLDDASLYANRELSWLDFNDRVLQLAEDESMPLLERAKFLAIWASNLDEFFMVRVAGLHDQVEAGIDARGPDGLSPSDTIDQVVERVSAQDERHSRQWEELIRPELAEQGIRVVSCDACDESERERVDRIFREQIFPALTPLAVGPGRPFPYISNLSLSVAIWVRDPVSETETFARVKVPKEVLPRLVPIGDGAFVPLEDVIASHLDQLFPGMEILHHAVFRVARDATFTAFHAEEGEKVDVFEAMRAGDLLVHQPYESFAASVQRFVDQAVEDPNVLAIKLTVYRTDDESSLIPALIRAAERGKQAVCMVELKARFDERRNIGWARALEEAGAHVVHGVPGLKTHAKALLVVRREGDGVRNYVHVGTGNYNGITARLYEDFGLFTVDPEITADVADLFNTLTGFGRPRQFRKALVPPVHLRDGILAEIERTVEAHEAGEQARIVMKMNSLVDRRCIEALYRASQAGVRIDLNVRGICCLIPGLEGVSENIHVVSVVGRFLEHSRLYGFQRGDESRYYMGSADLMPRNLDTRVELIAPVDDPDLRAELEDTLERCFADDSFAWELNSSGEWERRGRRERGAHAELMDRATERSMAVPDLD